jgi:signal transduction histidine kinase
VSEQPGLLHRYQRLIELSLDLGSTLDLDVLLQRIVHAAADLCYTQEASILLYDQVKKELRFEAATNIEKPLMRGFTVPVDSSIAGWIVNNRQPLVISDAQQDERLFRQIGNVTNLHTDSLLGVPMIQQDKVVGVLEAINKWEGEFTQEDQMILMALGAQAAVAIENARLFQQSDLISELVHEMRTPMASLNTAAYLLVRPSLDEEQRQRIVEMIRSETTRITELASTFLDLARLESGRAQFHPEAVELKQVLEDCDSLMRSRAIEKGLTVDLNLPANLPLIHADRDKIKQVIINLYSNAIKYNSPNGKITLVLCLDAERENVLIEVIDTGPGISPDDLKNLFQRFYRVPGSEKLASGTGLGLSICRRIIELHNGKIEAESQVGVGTTFRVRLPIKELGGD